ncbi:MAG: hypothetical protein ACTS27_07860 [Phycisphaerales bacterium]
MTDPAPGAPGAPDTPPNAVPPPPASKAKTPIAMPTGKLVVVSAAGAILAGLALWALLSFLRPASASGAPLGALAGFLGTAIGVLVIQPWKPRPITAWGTILLAAQGVAFFGVILFGVGLYSASRPDPVGLLTGAVASFLCATIAQASVAGARMKAALAG